MTQQVGGRFIVWPYKQEGLSHHPTNNKGYCMARQTRRVIVWPDKQEGLLYGPTNKNSYCMARQTRRVVA